MEEPADPIGLQSSRRQCDNLILTTCMNLNTMNTLELQD